MKTFIPHDLPQLMQINSGGDRVYQTPDGKKYPSVTSVVSLLSAQSIQEWREAVGYAEANQISKRASQRGTAIHSLCEQYLLGETPQPSMFDQEVFASLVPHLERIDNIHCLETRLFSHHLEVAGTVDVIAEYDGKLCVIDFKTSARVKSRDDITSYFMQTSAYAVAFEEMTGIPVGNLLILMGVDGSRSAHVFQEKRNTWIHDFRAARAEYKQVKGK